MAKKGNANNFGGGPKDLSKLPPGLRAYWEKKRAGGKGKQAESDAPADKQAKPEKPVKKPAKKTPARKKPTAKSTATKTSSKIGVRTKKRVRLSGTKQKQTAKPKREGANNPLVAKQLVNSRKK